MFKWLAIIILSIVQIDTRGNDSFENNKELQAQREIFDNGEPADNSTRWWFLKRVPAIITLESSSNPALLGQMLTYTVLVKGTTFTPTGTVTFEMSGHPWGKAVELDEHGQAISEPTLTIKPGSTISVHYSGDKFYDSGSQTVIQNIIKTTPLVTISHSNPLERDPRIIVNVTVTGTNKIPSGAVTITANGTVLNTPKALDERGQVSINVQLTPGQQTIVVFYSGDEHYNQASSKSLALKVTAQSRLKPTHRLQR